MRHLNIKLWLTVLISMVCANSFAHNIAVANSDGVTIYYTYTNNNIELAVSYLGSSYSTYSNEYSGNVVIPESVSYNGNTYSVTSIGSYAFYDCSGLTSVTIPNSVTSIGERALYGCSGLTSVTIPSSVTSIGERALYGCSGLTSVTIPSSVTSIGVSAFSGCSGLTSVTIPNSVTSIGERALYGCSGLSSIIVENGNTAYDSRDNCNAIIETSTNTLIAGCMNTVIPNSVTSIGSSAFWGCSGLTSVTIPNSVTSIGNYAFSGCSGLTSVTIPESVTTIGGYAFYDCSSLTSVTIPESVTTIGNYAFSGCSGLTSVTIPNSVTSIGGSAFSGCSSLTSVTIPESVTTIGGYAFNGTAWFDSQPDGVVYAGKVAYEYKGTMPSNTGIRLDDGTLSISDYAFSHCYGLSAVTIPNSVTSIGASAFSGCSNLYQAIIGNSVTSIGASAFSGCRRLYWFTIPNSVTSIGHDAFHGCNMTSITIPNSVTSIGYCAFADCSRLSSLVVEAGNTVYDSRDNCNAIIETSTNTLIAGCMNTVIPNTVTAIGDRAFYECSGLTSVTIPNSVTSIGIAAFFTCCDLNIVTIPSSVTYIGLDTFFQNTRLVAIKIDIKIPIEGSFFTLTKCTLYVPKGSKAAYQRATDWKKNTIREFPDADVNQDGAVNVVDVVAIARFVVGTSTPYNVRFLADLNNSGEVNVADAVVLVNEIAGDQNFAKAFGATSTDTGEDRLTLTGNDDHSLSLSMESERQYTAFQFDLTTDSDADVMAIALNAARKNGHQLLFNKTGEGRYRVVALSVANNGFNGTAGELLNIQLDGLDTDALTLSDIHFITSDGTDHRFGDLSLSSATGIESLTPNPSPEGEGNVYDLSGRKVSESSVLPKGVYIVNGKKVIVK